MDSPPESQYTQAEAYAPLEAAVADMVEVLPDFPGFERRLWRELACSHNGVDDPEYTNVELVYEFSVEDSATELVRERYVDALREHWTSLGYEITQDQRQELASGRVDRDLSADREDGVHLWYSAWGLVAVTVQSGCVPVSDHSDIEYIPPTGGIEPGGEGDLVGDYFPDGIPTDQAAAVDPFAATRAASGPVPFESPDSYEGQI
ncbi:hypothetical protein K3N28_16240 [Glycomyces sp. TRM65418]|uniref:hypothetical protein n=1 Tax=Glycomyces sp. TRM65418 TaxID=2867006 RepID=UPI001CE592CA|nr:hypothetical protein [Glycomyces sp. TRM65418]MCC3764609.1 hypothetical protein [Glycomyces sp. TRM65418]QZD54273.1 hypothetical protein K3N28_16155 [Glycomyces sp. TRM65418]